MPRKAFRGICVATKSRAGLSRGGMRWDICVHPRSDPIATWLSQRWMPFGDKPPEFPARGTGFSTFGLRPACGGIFMVR